MRTTIFAAAIVLMLATPVTASSHETQTTTIWGTGHYEFSGMFSAGVGFCTDPLGTELDCGSDLTSRGKGSFDVSGWNSESGATNYRDITVTAQLNGLRPGPATGYVLTVCSDLDDDNACSNVGGSSDPFGDGYSNSAGAASLTMCIPVDADGSFDDLFVFIGTWVGTGVFGGPTGAGTSEGAYTVTLEPGAFTSSC